MLPDYPLSSGIIAVAPWTTSRLFQSGVQLGTTSRRRVVTTDASSSGWDALHEGNPAYGFTALRLNPPHSKTLPTWDLSIVLGALKGPPFELLQTAGVRVMALKFTLLLALASVKQVGNLQALSVEFGPNDFKGFFSHAAAAMYRRCSRLSPLYPSLQRTVIKGLTCYAQFGQCEYTLSVLSHLDSQNRVFVCFGGHSKGLPVTKQRLYHWIVDAIVLVYASAGVQCPICVRAHSIRGMSSWDPTVWTSMPWRCGYYLLNATFFPSSGGKGL